MNANGLFIELNNGMPSGGWETNYGVQPTMLLQMLQVR